MCLGEGKESHSANIGTTETGLGGEENLSTPLKLNVSNVYRGGLFFLFYLYIFVDLF